MVTRAIQKIGPEKVKTISGELGALNKSEFLKNLGKGMTPEQAAFNTPAASLRKKLGFTRLEFVPQEPLVILKGHIK